MQMQSKEQLPLRLLAHYKKLGALFFKHLILLDNEEDSSSDVIEYDHHCEGAEIVLDFFKTKQQSILIKAFTHLRQHRPSYPPAQSSKPLKTTTRRTILNTTLSDASPIRDAYVHTIRSQKGTSSRLDLTDSKVDRSGGNLKQLLDRVKLANSRAQGSSYSFRHEYPNEHYHQENSWQAGYMIRPQLNLYTPAHARYRTNPTLSVYDPNTSHVISKKNSRRQFILDKFNTIENNLQKLGYDKNHERGKLSTQIIGEIHNIKDRLRL